MANHSIFSRMNWSEVQIHFDAAIFIASRAICSGDNVLCCIKALAAHQAQSPPLPTPITSSIYSTLPVPSSSTMRFLSITIKVASRCLSCFPVLHYFAYLMQLLRVCFGYCPIIVQRPYIKENASASEPANPQQTSPICLIFFAFVFTFVPPSETCPSPIMTVFPSFFKARIVV